MPSRLSDNSLTLDKNPLSGKDSTKVDEQPDQVASGGPQAGAPDRLGRTPVQDGTPEPPKTDWVEFVLVDPEGQPVPHEAYRVEFADGSVREGYVGEDGSVRFGGVKPGSCKISFPELDAGDWKGI